MDRTKIDIKVQRRTWIDREVYREEHNMTEKCREEQRLTYGRLTNKHREEHMSKDQ